jgi:hypothetical protein
VFYQLYKQQVDARIAKRWQALWVLRQGKRWKRVKEVGGSRKPIQRGCRAWYETMRLFTRRRRWEKGGCGRYINHPILLSPAERVLEEVRRWVEGRRYESIEAKKAAVEEVLRRLEAEGKVSSLVGWRYIRQALNALPS